MDRALDLLVVKDQSAEDAESPEFRYLLSWVVNQARKAFGSVALAVRSADGPLPALPEAPAVLLLGRANVLCTARSLGRLRDALRAGADIAAPRALTGALLADRPPIYTLRDFETLEADVLEREATASGGSGTQLPISLFSRGAFQRAMARFPGGELLARPCLLSELSPAVEAAGFFHEFVDYYGEVREDVLQWLPPGVKDVLEIGCARGLTGALMQERLGCRVTGVELNPRIAREAERRLARVLTGDVQTLPIDGSFDAIVATELFEHVEDPAALLAKLAGCLRPGGRIVLSLPSVGHYSVVEDLLAGRWDYLPIGLLCYTHVRFYTRATLQDCIERAWSGPFRIVPQTTELPSWVHALPPLLDADRESLGCKGFWVLLEAPPEPRPRPPDGYTVRDYAPGDEVRILELFERAFDRRRDLADWAWKYRDSPYGGLRISVAVDAEGRAAAHYAGYPVPFARGAGPPVTALQIGDTMTAPEVRGVGRRSTSLLARTAAHFYERFCTGRVGFNYGFNVGGIQKFSIRLLGAERVESVPLRVREATAGPLPAPGRWRGVLGGVTVERVADVDESWDALLEEVAPAYAFLVRRDARYVRWRYLQRPGGRYLVLAARRRGRLLAWGVFTRRDDTLFWGDALVRPDQADVVAQLLGAALAAPEGHGARRVQGWFSPRPAWFAAALDRLGFRVEPEPQDLALMCVPWQMPDAAALMRRDLYYTCGDSDLF